MVGLRVHKFTLLVKGKIHKNFAKLQSSYSWLMFFIQIFMLHNFTDLVYEKQQNKLSLNASKVIILFSLIFSRDKLVFLFTYVFKKTRNVSFCVRNVVFLFTKCVLFCYIGHKSSFLVRYAQCYGKYLEKSLTTCDTGVHFSQCEVLCIKRLVCFQHAKLQVRVCHEQHAFKRQEIQFSFSLWLIDIQCGCPLLKNGSL